MGNHDLALAAFRRTYDFYVAKHGPKHYGAVATALEMGYCLRDQGDEETARAWFTRARDNGQRACQREPDMVCLRAAMARCALDQCDAQAMTMVERGLQQDPHALPALEAKALVLEGLGKREQARKLYCQLRGRCCLHHTSARKRLERHCPRGDAGDGP
jgi:Tfp pilus assembly protein PilF